MKGLYIHIPFCKRKCAYCDFVSYSGMEHLADKYIGALAAEAEEYRGETIDSIFVGGGTPSLLSAAQIDKITRICTDTFNISPDCEFTFEANPGTLDDDKLKAMLSGGVNRISVGVQSFNDGELRKIGRIHDAQTAYNTICHIKETGFSNINIDLMTALPCQSMQSLKKTLDTAVSLPVTHISAYSLIVEDGTPLEREYSQGKLILPDEDTDREMYEYTVDFLRENGFKQYEISNFAREGMECRHNVKYWIGEEYIGLGAAAHSYMGSTRFFNTSDIESYISGAPREVTALTRKDKISEFMITGLRMMKGVSEKEFSRRFGEDISAVFGAELEKFINLKLMKYDGESYSLTPMGINVSNSVLCEFV
ncbi:MAG: radical SAM family heme chaperone HemW [Oscillospiraceae bacterium]|nr:radical SAM family heme chaperone HemW [Oscillospiraceae bacterium]